MKQAFFVYETDQVSQVEQYIEKVSECDVIAVGADVEFLLEKQGIAFRSARDMRLTPVQERLLYAEELGRILFSIETMPFLTYRDTHFGELFATSLQYYLAFFLYYVDIAASALESPYEEVVVYKSVAVVPPTAGIFGILGGQNTNFLPDALQLVCSARGTRLTFLKLPEKNMEVRSVAIKRALFGLGISVANLLVRMIVPRKKIRILASELWKNIGPLMNELPESELVLFDRLESFTAGLKAILRHRMRFIHAESYVTRKMHKTARERAQFFINEWDKIRGNSVLLGGASFRNYELRPILETAISQILAWSEMVVLDMDATWAMIDDQQPDVVLVRATASTQTHFAVLCEVARAHNIPSIEIQHGLLSPAPESFTKHHAAEYIAEYGPIVRTEWERVGYAPRSTFLDIGSPRFDQYRVVLPAEPKEDVFRVLVISASCTPGFWTDSYDVFDSYANIAEAVRQTPGVLVTIKIRPDANRQFYEEVAARAFEGISYRIAQSESFTTLLADTDVVISSHSTAMIEAMMSSRPIIYDASLPIFESFTHTDFAPHVASGALIVTHSANELHDALVRLVNTSERRSASERVESFMKEGYLFHDHQASKRLADTIRQLARNK